MRTPVNSARATALADRSENHILYSRLVNRLSEEEVDLMMEFIYANDELGHLDFEYKVNRMFLDKPKPKNASSIQDLLIACNFAVHGRTRSA